MILVDFSKIAHWESAGEKVNFQIIAVFCGMSRSIRDGICVCVVVVVVVVVVLVVAAVLLLVVVLIVAMEMMGVVGVHGGGGNSGESRMCMSGGGSGNVVHRSVEGRLCGSS